MSTTATTPPRFSWCMRLFLFCLLFELIFRSFSVLIPWENWIDDLNMKKTPARLPTRAEYAALRAQGGDALQKEFDKSFTSIRAYFNPWPEGETRARLTTWDAGGKYVVAWLASRLDILENVCGINEEWPMFSPNVGTGDYCARARLLYADGTEYLVRQNSEPADLTHFMRWNGKKILKYESRVQWKESRGEECWGWCNLLAYRYALNEDGSPLRQIKLYRVSIDYPTPKDEPRSFLRKQMELIRDPECENASRTFYTYDVATHEGEMAAKRN